MHRSLHGISNRCSMVGFGMSTSTVVGECTECYDIRNQEMSREFARRKKIVMQKYWEKKGDPKFIDIYKEQSP